MLATELQTSLIVFYHDHGIFSCDDSCDDIVKDLQLVEININVQGLGCSINFSMKCDLPVPYESTTTCYVCHHSKILHARGKFAIFSIIVFTITWYVIKGYYKY